MDEDNGIPVNFEDISLVLVEWKFVVWNKTFLRPPLFDEVTNCTGILSWFVGSSRIVLEISLYCS